VASVIPPTRHVAVLSELRKRIVEATLRPGDQIFADAIAEELHVSRIPVREALRVLEGEGQVFYEPHRGYFVAELRLRDLRELYLMRELLEAEALRLSVPQLD
jgi:DNA-binding GntR family transcriptional regulator